jgi:hypothetical protein
MGLRRPDKKLLEIFYAALPPSAFVEHKTFAGCPCCFVNGNMFAGVRRRYMVLRLSEEDRREFMGRYPSMVFLPFLGRQLREYVVVPRGLLQSRGELSQWVQRAFQYAMTLPGH